MKNTMTLMAVTAAAALASQLPQDSSDSPGMDIPDTPGMDCSELQEIHQEEMLDYLNELDGVTVYLEEGNMACRLESVFDDGAMVVGMDADCQTKDITYSGRELFTLAPCKVVKDYHEDDALQYLHRVDDLISDYAVESFKDDILTL